MAFNPNQERDDKGKWSDGDGSGSGGGKGGKTPPIKAWREPPPPQGRKGIGGSGGRTAVKGLSLTDMGKLGEEATSQLDFRDLHPGKAQGPLDREYDHSGFAFELKTVSVNSTEYKFRPKAHEVAGKLAYARSKGLKAGSMMGVLDMKRGEVHFYWKEGINFARLTKDWNYAGTVKLKGKR